MKKYLVLLILISFLVAGCGSNPVKVSEDFCGSSTKGVCSSDDDCIAGGCSGQVCQSKSDEQMFTTCEYRDCYDNEKYNLECKCVENECTWD